MKKIFKKDEIQIVLDEIKNGVLITQTIQTVSNNKIEDVIATIEGMGFKEQE